MDDLMNKYFYGCSPYILSQNYDLDKREVVFVCANNTNEWVPGKQLTFRGVLSFSEEAFEDVTDDECRDSIIGIRMVSDGIYCVHTEKRELTIHVSKEPVSLSVE